MPEWDAPLSCVQALRAVSQNCAGIGIEAKKRNEVGDGGRQQATLEGHFGL